MITNLDKQLVLQTCACIHDISYHIVVTDYCRLYYYNTVSTLLGLHYSDMILYSTYSKYLLYCQSTGGGIDPAGRTLMRA
jgi:hypothetical protein